MENGMFEIQMSDVLLFQAMKKGQVEAQEGWVRWHEFHLLSQTYQKHVL